MFKYFAFGLTVQSELFFPELFTTQFFGNAEICITVGPVPILSTEANSISQNNIIIKGINFFLDIPGVAKYYSSKGKFIVIEPVPNCDLNKLRLYCLSNVFAALLYQRGIIPIHSAALKFNDSLVMICGNSGSGKSTLLASMISRGFTLFSDDVCVPVSDTSKGVFMHSSYPMMKFWKDTYTSFSFLGTPDVQLRPDLSKYGFYFHDKFDTNTYKPNVVFFMEKSPADSEVRIREVQGAELFQKLESNAYRGEFLGRIDLRQEHFKLFADLANQVKGYLVVRPEGLHSVEEITNIVTEVLKKNNL